MTPDQRILFESQVEYDLFVSRVSEIAKEKVHDDLSKSRSRMAVLMTGGLTLFVAALTGVATFGLNTLQASISDKISANIQSSVPAAIEEALAAQLPIIRQSVQSFADDQIKKGVADAVGSQVDKAVLAWDLVNARAGVRDRLQEIEATGTFTDSDLKTLVAEVERIGKYDEISSSDEFLKLLERVIDILSAADEYTLVYTLEGSFKEEMVTRMGISWTMVTSLGRRIVGYKIEPAKMTGGKIQDDWNELVKKYHFYADAARRNGIPELPFIYDFVLACIESRSEQERSALLARIDDLTDSEHQFVVMQAGEILAESWRRVPDSFSRRVMTRTDFCAKSSVRLATSTRSHEFIGIFTENSEL
jgi:hypothetical protein